MKIYLIVLLSFLGQWVFGQSENRIEGPVIFGYGATYEIEDPDFEIDADQEYKVIFDLYQKNSNPEKINTSLNTIARFINMHANLGVDVSDMKIVAVVHGSASSDIMDDEFHNEKYDVDNPNADLISKLQKAGVEFYLCGQTMHVRNLDRDQILEGVNVALSAMTVNNYFVAKGYSQL
ncbi:DsrE family protein [Portibacter lacus]|uniref:DsrE family protein n=1 Tax=Portibacter lacus TaxID=1099794 RepID=A0AA37SL57_9BACT|nr:DsrE family protein [Portibacter lacus]GLR15940.1 hypothetical protein GCM10007940_05550 [Portibacter lacus]